MSVAEKIKTPNNEIIQPKKMGLSSRKSSLQAF